ncbi:MBL fold metallo-hydrolase [Acinetobacter radioresistens]|nr:MBL fold metallo-hydrolase [Acinetobacter radioresistens]
MNTKQARLYALPAGQGDCLLFQFENNDGVFRHILVDGGNRTKIEFNKLRKTILEILKEGDDGNIDLLVVTHSDDDHISGVLKILADDELNQKIKKIWFNSEKSISDYFKTSFNGTQRYEILESVKGISKSSRNQDYDLYKLLKND